MDSGRGGTGLAIASAIVNTIERNMVRRFRQLTRSRHTMRHVQLRPDRGPHHQSSSSRQSQLTQVNGTIRIFLMR